MSVVRKVQEVRDSQRFQYGHLLFQPPTVRISRAYDLVPVDPQRHIRVRKVCVCMMPKCPNKMRTGREAERSIDSGRVERPLEVKIEEASL